MRTPPEWRSPRDVLLALLGTSSWPFNGSNVQQIVLPASKKDLCQNAGFGKENTAGTKIRFCLEFDGRESVFDRLKQEAGSLGLTAEKFIKRFVVDALAGDDDSLNIAGETLQDSLEKNGAIRPRQDD